MEIVIPLISGVIANLCNTSSLNLSRFTNSKRNLNAMVVELQKLTDKRDDLAREVEHIEINGLVCTNRVKVWLERVESIEVKVGLMLNDLEKHKNRCSCYCISNCSTKFKVGNKAPRILEAICELKMEAESMEIVENGSIPPPVENIPNLPTVGLEIMLEKVHDVLADDEIGRIGIYGMGGAGKTTLMKSVNNEFLTKNHDFDVVICVFVSKDFVIEKIQQSVGMRLGLTWVESEDHHVRSAKIYRILMRKKFLLLLDDVWEGIDLMRIGIPSPDKRNKCKLIFTTRSMDICSDMDAHQKLKHDFLKENDSWKLFSEKVGGMENLINSPNIRPYADIIVRKCGGLPLALITTGRAMSNKQTEEEWKYAVEVLEKSPTELRGMRSVFTLLKFSYDNLHSDTLRSCFLYCALFPEDYLIEREQLVQYWIGEGFLEGAHGNSNDHNKGYTVIGDLKIACLLEDGDEKTQVKMHDVVRKFALWVASDFEKKNHKYVIDTSTDLSERNYEKWNVAEKISLMNNAITMLSEKPDCPNLTTLMLQQNNHLQKIEFYFFDYMPVLRVLDLSSTSITEIPSSIGMLHELRYLDLSDTMITTLPNELGNLSKLQHLDLQRVYSLVNIPREAISGLTQLRSLNLYYSYGFWEVQNSKYDDQITFQNLESLRKLTTFGITVTEFHTLKKLSEIKSLLKCLQYLYIKDCEGLVHVQIVTASNDGELLRRLSISDCHELKYMVVGDEAGRRWLPSLEVLTLYNLPNLVTMWKNQVTDDNKCLFNLRSVNIQRCNALRNISWVFRLPKVEEIFLSFCGEMEEVVGGEVAAAAEGGLMGFSKLETLVVQDLPELKSVCNGALRFPCLRRFKVIDCPKLMKLPFQVSGLSMFPTINGDKEWWDALEWDENDTKTALLPYFVST